VNDESVALLRKADGDRRGDTGKDPHRAP
jgi:hypothetical protein